MARLLKLTKFQERTRMQEMSTETPIYMFMGRLTLAAYGLSSSLKFSVTDVPLS